MMQGASIAIWRGLLVLLIAEGCDGNSRPAPSLVYLQPAVLDAGFPTLLALDASGAASPTLPLLPDWCGGERGALDASLHIGEIADAYRSAQQEACGRLTEGMLASDLASWATYLYDYTYVMAGCVDLFMPPPGGILAFGPANTAAVGVPHAPLRKGDVAVLISAYLSAFASALSLADPDRGLVEEQLWRSAEPELDPRLGDGLGVCASVADAGN